jgi:nicotinamide-nucleotide amidase
MDFDALAKTTLQTARDNGLMISTAESCTGGLIAAALTEIPGSSDVVDRGFITYSNAAKIDMLGISPDTLVTFGAVSEQIAAEMAEGALRQSIADITVSVTGIAGPGSSDHKPEGRVCFGIAQKGLPPRTETIEFGAIGRSNVRSETVKHALALLTKTMASSNA